MLHFINASFLVLGVQKSEILPDIIRSAQTWVFETFYIMSLAVYFTAVSCVHCC